MSFLPNYLLTTLLSVGPLSAVLVLPSDSSTDSIGMTFDSGSEQTRQWIEEIGGSGAAIGLITVDFGTPEGSDISIFGAIWAYEWGGMAFEDSNASYSFEGRSVFRFSDSVDVPSDLSEPFTVSFDFSLGGGFVEGSNNLTRFANLERVQGNPSEDFDAYPFWIQWDIAFDEDDGTVMATPIAALGEEGTPLTPRQAAIAIGAIPEPTSAIQLFLGSLILLGNRKRKAVFD